MSCIMCQYGLAVCGHVGVAMQASGVLFITRGGTCVRARQAVVESDVISRQRRTCLNLSVSTCFFIADSLVVTHVEFPTFLSFESETCRVSGIWETRG